MEPTPKFALLARGILGPLFALAAIIGAAYGFEFSPETQEVLLGQTEALILAATALVGSIVGIWGRWKATRPVTLNANKAGPILGCLLAGLLLLPACASFMGGETPEQQFYAAQGLYVIVAEEAVAYVENPGADPDVVAVLRAADEEAYRALVLGRQLLAQPSSPDRDNRLSFYARAAQLALAKLTAALEENPS